VVGVCRRPSRGGCSCSRRWRVGGVEQLVGSGDYDGDRGGVGQRRRSVETTRNAQVPLDDLRRWRGCRHGGQSPGRGRPDALATHIVVLWSGERGVPVRPPTPPPGHHAVGWLPAREEPAAGFRVVAPKPRRGSHFPEWLLEPRRQAEQALIQVACQCYVEACRPAAGSRPTSPPPVARRTCRSPSCCSRTASSSPTASRPT
jgi:hypothetical protein